MRPLNRIGEQSVASGTWPRVLPGFWPEQGWLWAEAAHASNYIYNQLPHSAVGCSPFELRYGHKPNIANLHVWGCLAYVHLQKDQREELEYGTHTRLWTFIAYCDHYKGWEFLEHETRNRVVSRDVLWQENTFKNAPWTPWPEEHPGPQPPTPQEAPAAPQYATILR